MRRRIPCCCSIPTPSPESYAGRFERYRFGVIDATAIAREQGIGSSAVVIINTTILGAYAPLAGIAALGAGKSLCLAGAERRSRRPRNMPMSRCGSAKPVQSHDAARRSRAGNRSIPAVGTMLGHNKDFPATLKTGSWSNQAPVYSEHSAPCNLACPAGNDVVGFIQALRNGASEEAAAILLRTQPLPSVCGRVCPAPCMQACNREAFDGAVNIRSLERWIGDHADAGAVAAKGGAAAARCRGRRRTGRIERRLPARPQRTRGHDFRSGSGAGRRLAQRHSGVPPAA